jgi:hypothetical protein
MRAEIYSGQHKLGNADFNIIGKQLLNLPNDGEDRYIIRYGGNLEIGSTYKLKPDGIPDTATVKIIAYDNGEYEAIKAKL